MLFLLIPIVWFAVASLFAAMCRVASYGEQGAIARSARLRNDRTGSSGLTQ